VNVVDRQGTLVKYAPLFAATVVLAAAVGCGSSGSGAGGSGGSEGAASGGSSGATGGNGTGGVSTGGSGGPGGSPGSGGVGQAGGTVGGGLTGSGGSGAAGGDAGTGGSSAAGGHAGNGGSGATGGHAGGGGQGGHAGNAGAGGLGGHAGGAGAGGGGHGGSAGGAGAGAGGAAAFSPCPASGAACNVMPLGDSITDGVGSSAPGGGYRVELFHAAVQAHQAFTFVGSATDPNGPTTLDGKMFPRNHEGHPGYTIDDSATTSGISPLVDQSIATNHPQIILLMIGTNDINRSIDAANAPTRLGALLDRMINDAPNALLVVAKITPWMDDGANASVVQTYNNAITGVVQTRAANGKHVVAVDMLAAFTANPNYKTALMSDYLHPNDAGYVVMGDVWYAAIKSYLPAAP
jgi:lysophospholipase L1-like esterase